MSARGRGRASTGTLPHARQRPARGEVAGAAEPPEVLRVREITVVDAKGTERVWTGAPVPDPIGWGKRSKRAAPASGIVLLDAKGDERSRYLTSDTYGEVWLGLDSEEAQEATFLANRRRRTERV